jgi:hypothetical protein
LDEDVGGEFFFVEGAEFFEGDLDLGGAFGELVFVFLFLVSLLFFLILHFFTFQFSSF